MNPEPRAIAFPARIVVAGATLLTLLAALLAIVMSRPSTSDGATIELRSAPTAAHVQSAVSARARGASKPTVVLVHGAFADASGWNAVTRRLQAAGYTVIAPGNPLRGIPTDVAYLKDLLSTIEGPVVLVGHSYGGAVITNAATGNPNVEALVYIAAYALDEGESVAEANELGGGHSDLIEHLTFRPYPGAPEGDYDVTVDPAHFRRIFAADLPRTQTQVMGASQRAAALSGLIIPSGEPAWRTTPSYYMVASRDGLIPPEAERAMAERAGAHTVSVASSHVAMMSHPDEVVALIRKADRQN